MKNLLKGCFSFSDDFVNNTKLLLFIQIPLLVRRVDKTNYWDQKD